MINLLLFVSACVRVCLSDEICAVGLRDVCVQHGNGRPKDCSFLRCWLTQPPTQQLAIFGGLHFPEAWTVCINLQMGHWSIWICVHLERDVILSFRVLMWLEPCSNMSTPTLYHDIGRCQRYWTLEYWAVRVYIKIELEMPVATFWCNFVFRMYLYGHGCSSAYFVAKCYRFHLQIHHVDVPYRHSSIWTRDPLAYGSDLVELRMLVNVSGVKVPTVHLVQVKLTSQVHGIWMAWIQLRVWGCRDYWKPLFRDWYSLPMHQYARLAFECDFSRDDWVKLETRLTSFWSASRWRRPGKNRSARLREL